MNNSFEDFNAGSDKLLPGAQDECLWAYIDGLLDNSSLLKIESLIATNELWERRYQELLELHHLLHQSVSEEPSLRFTKNVMEHISRVHITGATKEYINNKIIWGISGFLIVLIIGLLAYGISVARWSADGSGNGLGSYLKEVDYTKFFDRDFLNVFMMLNVVGCLLLLDRYLARHKNKTFEGDHHTPPL